MKLKEIVGRRVKRFSFSLVVAAFVAMPSFAKQPDIEDPVVPFFLADANEIKPGESFRLGVLFQIKPGWHLYWKNPGDSGIPTRVKINLPEQVTSRPLRWPTPIRFEQAGGVVGYGYKKSVLLSTVVTPSEFVKYGSRLGFSAETNWLACSAKLCVPGKATLSMHAGVLPKVRPAYRKLFERWEKQLPIPASSESTPATVRTKGSILKLGESAEFSSLLKWKVPPKKVEWFPGVADELGLELVSIDTKEDKSKIVFRAISLPGVSHIRQTLDTLVAFESKDGIRRSLSIPVRLRK